jgi:Protein of unknown function (DUF1573)
MKKMVWLLAIATVAISCNDRKNDKIATNANGLVDKTSGQAGQKITDSTTVQVLDTLYDFGTIKEGDKAEFSFRFKNTGTKPLIIESASASCGCTVPEKPEQPIKPGEMGFIKVVFNSKGKPGSQMKNVTVISNAYPGFPLLALKGEVTPEKQ